MTENGKVTQKDLYEAIQGVDKIFRDFATSIDAKLDNLNKMLFESVGQNAVVISRVDRIEKDFATLDAKVQGADKTSDGRIDELEKQVTALQVKAGVWGLFGGLVPALIALLWWFANQ